MSERLLLFQLALTISAVAVTATVETPVPPWVAGMMTLALMLCCWCLFYAWGLNRRARPTTRRRRR